MAIGSNSPMGGKAGAVSGKPQNFLQSLKTLAVYLKRYWFAIISSLILAVIGTISGLFGPKIIEILLKEVLIGIPIEIPMNFVKIGTIGGVLVGLYLIACILEFTQHFIMANVTATASMRLRGEISTKINRLPLSFFDKRSYGDVLSCVTNDVDTIGQTLNQSLSSMITSVTMLVGVITMMFTMSIQLTCISLVSIPVSLILVGLVIMLSQKYFRKQQNSLGAINGHVEEIYSAHSVVKVFNGANKASEKFNVINADLMRSGYKAQFLSGMMMPLMGFIGNITFVIVIVVGSITALESPLFISTVVAFVMYIKRLNQPISQVATIMSTLQSTAAASERVFNFINAEEQSKESIKIEVKGIKGKVEFKNVSFGYDADKIIVRDFNCLVKPGQKIAIVGPTGAGKTTLVNLLMRFYEINEGEILIDNTPINDYTREQVRSIFGMVLQDTWLFEGTIRENILFGKDEVGDEKLYDVCKACKIDHFIRALPNGYDMILKENSNISQGQKQLFTIARAMIENAPILILDEATSSVDTRTELLIQQAMDKLTEDRTSFVIAHRLSTIKNADIILVMRDGNIVEMGSHDELISKNGFYNELYNSQFSDEGKA